MQSILPEARSGAKSINSELKTDPPDPKRNVQVLESERGRSQEIAWRSCAGRVSFAQRVAARRFSGNSGVAIEMDVYSTFQRARARGVPGERGRPRRATFCLLFSVLVAGFCSVAAVADAAEVLQLRLGRHQAFTRVVFELDSPAGYSLEQNVLSGGRTELVVTLDASATNQEKSLRGALVRKVSLTGQGKRSVARIQLSAGELRVKEMILGSPPRIVLDVLAPPTAKSSKTAKVATPKPRVTEPTRAAAKPIVKPVAKKVAKPAAKPAAKPTIAKPAATKPSARPTAKPIAKPQVKAVAPVASVNHGASPAPTRVKTRPAVAPAARPTPAPRPAASAKPSVPTAQKPPSAAPTGLAKTRVAKTPPPPARKKPATRPSRMPAAPAAIPESTSGSLFTARNVGGGLALLGLVGGGTFFMLRRRAGKELPGEEGFDDDPFAEDNPFASLGDDPGAGDALVDTSGSSDQTAELPFADQMDESAANVVDEFGSDDDRDIPVAKVSADAGSQENVFDTSTTGTPGADDTLVPGAENAAAAGDKMETYGDATVNTGVDAMPPIPGDGGDTMRMLREFEQRMASLESRLDEVMESKERLERQVTAQTEELRVQRAAIARTQRALRNLTRPDDDSATEPALRDPNT